jgi:hypothetical protein
LVAARAEPADDGSVCCNNHDRLDLPAALRARKAPFVSTGHGLRDLAAEICGFIGRPSEQREIEWALSRWTPKSWKRWLALCAYFDAQLSWHGRKPMYPVPGPSHQLLALGIDAAADEASGLLPRRARLDGPTPVGDNPAELVASAEQLLRRICGVGAPTRLLGLRVLVAELVWEANTGAGT